MAFQQQQQQQQQQHDDDAEDLRLRPLSNYAWLHNAAITSGCGAVAGLGAGVYRRQSLVLTPLSMAATWGLTSLLFFGTRQAFQQSLMAELALPVREQRLRRDRDAMVASLCAGALTGGVTGAFYSGVRGAGSSVAVYTIAAGVGQLVFTTTRHLRQDVVLWYLNRTRGHVSSPSSAPPTAATGDERISVWQSYKLSMQEWMRSLPSWSPVRMISDEEYLQRLQRQLADNQVELKKYQAAIQRLEARTRELEK
ncbi:hypothetical protein RI367_004521 [Sorochytrium milnesiophthora]